jgi:hypothetical protein
MITVRRCLLQGLAVWSSRHAHTCATHAVRLVSLEFREALSGTPRMRLRSVMSSSSSSLIVVVFYSWLISGTCQ